jgi:2-polyprenyl-3-methyl-5-hydroxy-6-metoxy-1,4-benzoquinol methylase
MPLKQLAHRVGRAYIAQLTKREEERQTFRLVNERPIEYGFAFTWLTRLQPKTVLDAGTGTTAFPALLRTCGFIVRAIDNVKDYWPRGMVNRHWQVHNEDIMAPGHTPPHDVVTCISVIEHTADSVAAMRGLRRLTVDGGHLILTTPFGAEGHPNVFAIPGSAGHANPYICRQHAPSDLARWLECGFTLVHQEHWRLFASPFCSVGTLVRPPQPTSEPSNIGCFVLRAS